MVNEYMTWDSEKEWLRMMADAVEEPVFTKESYDEKKPFYTNLFICVWGCINRYCGAM